VNGAAARDACEIADELRDHDQRSRRRFGKPQPSAISPAVSQPSARPPAAPWTRGRHRRRRTRPRRVAK
jgi:hypothetical protein